MPAGQDGIAVVDRDYCTSSFLALRHVYRAGTAWMPGVVPVFDRRELDDLASVSTAAEMDESLERQLQGFDPFRTGVLLSGGMDSAIVASYLKPGTRAFTFRFDDKGTPSEVDAARVYADRLGLRLVEVPIGAGDYTSSLVDLMNHRRAPVHSIEPQIYKALIMARELGVDTMVTGENADAQFGGFDRLVGSEWSFEEFVRRYSFVDPTRVLRRPADCSDAFEGSRRGESVDPHHFMSSVFAEESLNSYLNPASLAGIEHVSPFAAIKMADSLDTERVRRGESKYLVRELYGRRFDGEEPRSKLPMPRSVKAALAAWGGPTRPEFLPAAIEGLSADQRWMIFVLERYLDVLDGT